MPFPFPFPFEPVDFDIPPPKLLPRVVELPLDAAPGVGALFEVHYVHLVRLARHLLEDPSYAEDVVMDAFAGLEQRWTKVRGAGDVFFYLRTSVVNGTRSRRRLPIVLSQRV